MSEQGYKGAAIRSLPRPTKKYTTGRVCGQQGCETKLSVYNRWVFCWQHEPVHSYVPRGKRKSRKAAA